MNLLMIIDQNLKMLYFFPLKEGDTYNQNVLS